MVNKKIIVDTSVLVAASLNHVCEEEEGIKIQDNFYNISRPLLDYFKENVDLNQGLVTSIIETSAKTQIRNAFFKKIAQMKKTNFNDLRLKMQDYSMSLILITDALQENLNILTRIPINEKIINKLCEKVNKFYFSLITHLQSKDPKKIIKRRVKEAPRELKGIMRKFAKEDEESNEKAFKKLIKKLEQNPPDINDYKIIAQAMHLKSKIYPQHEIFITSTDQHITKIRLGDGSLNTFISDEIEKRFHILTKWPDEMLKILKENKE